MQAMPKNIYKVNYEFIRHQQENAIHKKNKSIWFLWIFFHDKNNEFVIIPLMLKGLNDYKKE